MQSPQQEPVKIKRNAVTGEQIITQNREVLNVGMVEQNINHIKNKQQMLKSQDYKKNVG